jgi:hypothetical protein
VTLCRHRSLNPRMNSVKTKLISRAKVEQETIRAPSALDVNNGEDKSTEIIQCQF